ncbi:MAG: hypothetical protein NDJ89_12985 [Oligoflexia bacterium]|nr:hypothetical protein [Oligoflexia bacterium]
MSNAGTVSAVIGATFRLGSFELDTVLGNTGRDSGFTNDAFAKIGVIYRL